MNPTGGAPRLGWSAVNKRSEPRIYPYPPAHIFNAATSGLSQSKLSIRGADPNQGTIWAEKGMSAASWGEKVTIYIAAAGEGHTTVTVDSALKFGLVAWGAHDRNFKRVFEAIDQGLAQTGQVGTPPPPQPGPTPPPQPQQPQAPTPSPQPGAALWPSDEASPTP
jgi:hypothetical protein